MTEYGIANLKGKSVSERAQALIALAPPRLAIASALYHVARFWLRIFSVGVPLAGSTSFRFVNKEFL
ncbi:MAG: acetyl-CoA hydrolase/transferase C-terminal domain-containing protein [Burkholderiaceae bacterium]|nr:acetyl-CoA hydrolase/transferase C-terminal domain-containing protein [Burkholderiaceae bacterium]